MPVPFQPRCPATDLDFILERTLPFWEDFRNKKILITGGTGFFGTWLLESFVWINARLGLNATAVVLSRNPEEFLARHPYLAATPTIRFHTGDVRDFDFPPDRFSHVIHAATTASARLNDTEPWTMIDTIVRGTQHVLECAVASGARKFLLTSSGAVYGQQPSDMTHLEEDFAGAPDSKAGNAPYAVGKRLAEVLCHRMAAASMLETKIARGFAFVGPGLPLDLHFAAGNFIRDALRGGPIVINGDGRPLRSYLYAADLTAWLWIILFAGPTGEAINVGSDQAFPLSEIARKIAGLTSPSPEIVIRAPEQSGPASRYIPSIAKARRLLGLDVWHSLDQALEKTFEWYRQRYFLKCDGV